MLAVYYVANVDLDNGVIVCQFGEGSDELFWGYSSWRVKLRLQQLGNLPFPRTMKRIGLKALELSGHQAGLPYEWLRRNVADLPIFWGGVDAFTETQKQHLLSARLRRQLKGLSSWDALAPLRRRFVDKDWEQSPLSWMSYVDLNLRLPELLLMRVDKMSMAVSLEARVPFLDHKFVELAMSIPQAVKTRHNTLKYILKKSVRNLIPDEMIDRKKQGFGVPVREWIADRLGELTRRELTQFCDETDFLDAKEVGRLLMPKMKAYGFF